MPSNRERKPDFRFGIERIGVILFQHIGFQLLEELRVLDRGSHNYAYLVKDRGIKGDSLDSEGLDSHKCWPLDEASDGDGVRGRSIHGHSLDAQDERLKDACPAICPCGLASLEVSPYERDRVL